MTQDEGVADSLTDYIVTPEYVTYQKVENYIAAANNFANECWGPSAGYLNNDIQTNYANKNGYDAWKNDYLWIPAMDQHGRKGTWSGSSGDKTKAYVGFWGNSERTP